MPACLDSWAVLAWLDGDEPAAAAVSEALECGRPGMSWINLVEVHYRLARDHGSAASDEVLSDLRGRVDERLPGVAAMRAVARLKADHPIALADCFAVEAAAAAGEELLTGDPEILDRAEHLPCLLVDLR